MINDYVLILSFGCLGLAICSLLNSSRLRDLEKKVKDLERDVDYLIMHINKEYR